MIIIYIFSVLDFFCFYIFFEGIVIPMFLLIVFEEVVQEKFMRHINFLFILY